MNIGKDEFENRVEELEKRKMSMFPSKAVQPPSPFEAN